MAFSINRIKFETQESFENFIHSDTFLVLIAASIQNNSNSTDDKTVLSIIVDSNGQNKSYLDLVQNFVLNEHGALKTYYKWKVSYDSSRHSGGNYSEPTKEQTDSMSYLRNLASNIEAQLSALAFR